MAEKNFNARFKQKHDIEANWAKAAFAPLAGEFIVYDVDENNPFPRIKIGDGETQINDLPSVDEGKMSYLGEVTELPQTANEGDVCTFNNSELISDKQFIDYQLEAKTSPNEFYGIEIIYSSPLEGFGISDTIGEYDIIPSKYLYIVDKNNIVHSLKVNKVIYKAHYAPGSPYQDGFTTLYYEDFTDFPQYSTEMRFEGKAYYVGDEPASISFEQKEYLMIYRNSKWEKLVSSDFATESYVDQKVSEIEEIIPEIPSDAKSVRSFTTTGSGSIYTATIDNYTTYTKGDVFIMIPHTTATTTSPRLNINNLGNKYIYRTTYSSGSTTSLRSTTELSASYPVMLVYNGSYFVMVDNKQPYGDTDFYNKISASKLGAGAMVFKGTVDSLSTISGAQKGDTYKPTIIRDDRQLTLTVSGIESIRPLESYEGYADYGVDNAIVNCSSNSDIARFLQAAKDAMYNTNNYNWNIQVGSQSYGGQWITTTSFDSTYYYSFWMSMPVDQATEMFVNGNTAICKIEVTSALPSDLQSRLEGDLITNDDEKLYMYDGSEFITYGAGGSGNSATPTLNDLGVTATATELNYVDGVTSNIQTQLNNKAPSEHNHEVADITGTMSVSKGGTGTTTFTSGTAIIGNGTDAFTTRSITNNTGTSDSISGSTNLITLNTLRYAINRTTSVAAADTNYSTYMARGTSLNSTETTPAANGTVAWTYE